MLQLNSKNFKEYLLSINEFVQPKILTGDQAVYTDIIRLFLLEPGTNQTHPNMGIGIRSNYRFSDTDDIAKLKQDTKLQIQTYLPNLLSTNIDISFYGTTLVIFITTEDEYVYAIGYNTDTGDIGSLTLDNIK